VKEPTETNGARLVRSGYIAHDEVRWLLAGPSVPKRPQQSGCGPSTSRRQSVFPSPTALSPQQVTFCSPISGDGNLAWQCEFVSGLLMFKTHQVPVFHFLPEPEVRGPSIGAFDKPQIIVIRTGEQATCIYLRSVSHQMMTISNTACSTGCISAELPAHVFTISRLFTCISRKRKHVDF
jgi:hypothetical protein